MKIQQQKQMCEPNTVCAVACATLSILLAGIYWLCRFGFKDNSVLIFVPFLSLSCFILLFPIFLRKFFSNSSHALLLLLSLALLTCLGFVTAYLPFPVAPVLLVAGVLLFLWYGFAVLRSLKPQQFFLGLCGLCIFAFMLANAGWMGGYQNTMFIELLASGYVQRDTLFHSAISSMIQTYGVPSTGLDGIPSLHYHFGSHWFFAQLAEFISLKPLQFYLLGYPIIFLPLFFYSFLLLVIELKAFYGETVREWCIAKDASFWLTFFILLLGIFPGTLAVQTHIKQSLASESYALSLLLSFLSAAILLQTLVPHLSQPKKIPWVSLLLSIFLLALLTFMKASMGLLCGILLLYLFFRFRLYRSLKCWLSFFLMAVVFLFVFIKTTPITIDLVKEDRTRGLFFESNSIPGAVREAVISLFCNSLIFIVYAAYRLWEEKQRKKQVGQNALPQRVDLEMIVVLFISVVLFLMSIQLGNGIHVYFTDVQKWLGFILLLSILPRLQQCYSGLRASRKKLACAGVVFLCFGAFGNLLNDGKDFIGRMIYHRYWIMNGSQGKEVLIQDFTEFKSKFLADSFAGKLQLAKEKFTYLKDQPQKIIEQNEFYHLLRKMQDLPFSGPSHHQELALYIPRTNTLYWNDMLACEIKPMVGPAITAYAFIRNLHDCHSHWEVYGYYAYKSTDFKWHYEDLSPVELKNRALDKGFSRVLLMSPQGILEPLNLP